MKSDISNAQPLDSLLFQITDPMKSDWWRDVLVLGGVTGSCY